MRDESIQNVSDIPESIEDLKRKCEESAVIISNQRKEIEDLKHEIDVVVTERDMLLCEVSKLKFEIEISSLKRLRDVSRGVVSGEGMSEVQLNVRPDAVQDSYQQKNDRSQYVTTYSHSSNVNRGHALHKKGSVRDNGEILKRSRVQNSYELSQDLLDKQIEMLERKYGGMKARNAALTIQRAFRRYTLLKKFAAITAMAKAEKRLSRRLQGSLEHAEAHVDSDTTIRNNFAGLYQELRRECSQQSNSSRILPLRSMSMRERERRSVDNVILPRSQSSRCDMAQENVQGEYYTPTSLIPCRCYSDHKNYWDMSQYYVPHEMSAESTQVSSSTVLTRDSSLRKTIATLPHHSVNMSWPSKSNLSVSRSWNQAQKIPPEVPKRTSSITSRSNDSRIQRLNGLTKTRENGSLSSVQSSGSDSSVSTDRITCESFESENHRCSPVWKRKDQETIAHSKLENTDTETGSPDHQEMPSHVSKEHSSTSYQIPHQDHVVSTNQTTVFKVSETVRKRQYRVGLNLFNKKPERGISYLIRRGFLENSPQGVAKFLIARKGLSKQMVGEYLGNIQDPFNMAVLECFSQELDLSDMQIDMALRKFQTYFRMPGEAQKIERLMEVFGQRYCQCNRDIALSFRSPDTVFVLAFAIIMLNTDLHTPNLKPDRRMKLDDFIKNLRGIDDGVDIDRDILVGIYERVKSNEFKPGSDHVSQVMKVQSTIVGKKPNMALPHRRLVCYCRLYEIPDIYKKERPGVHQREVFLFNDLLVITKILSKKKSSVTYTFRESFPLCGMVVTLFEAQFYPFGIRLSQKVDGKVLMTFNARNEHDRCKFVEDLRESISEMDEMENLRIDAELERQKSGRGGRASTENRDSGVADVEVCPCSQSGFPSQGSDGYTETINECHSAETVLKRSALSNSLLDIQEQCNKPQRRGSMGSLDSGMSITFQSMSSGNLGHDNNASGTPQMSVKGSKVVVHQQSFLGGLFTKRDRKSSRAEEPNSCSRSTEV